MDALLTHGNRLVDPSFVYTRRRRPNVSVTVASRLIAIPAACVSELLVVIVDAVVGQGAFAAPVDLFVLREELSGAHEDLINLPGGVDRREAVCVVGGVLDHELLGGTPADLSGGGHHATETRREAFLDFDREPPAVQRGAREWVS